MPIYIYSSNDLQHQFVQQQAEEALLYNCISGNTYGEILKHYTCSLYTPNYFIRIALILLTVVSTIFAGVFIGLLFSASNSNSLAVLLIFLAIVTYALLEAIVKRKNYYNAGVDNTLMLFSVAFLVSAFVAMEVAPAVVCFIAFLTCSWMAIRFTDSFMTMLAYVAFLSFVFLLFTQPGGFTKAMAPFVLMTVSAITYFVMDKFEEKRQPLFYQACFKWVRLLTLISLYVSCNYYVVQTMTNETIFSYTPAASHPVPFGWLFWLLTITIPPAYIVYGIKKKDLRCIRTGLVLAAVSIVTFRYYYSIVPAEIAMLAGGVSMCVISWWLMQYLKMPHARFVFGSRMLKSKDTRALEALLLVETTGKKELHQTPTQFGGGSFGGGGGGSSY